MLLARLFYVPPRAAGALAVAVLVAFHLPALRVAEAEIDPMALPYETITFTGQDNLRDFVGQHLGDPDLWPAVLAMNRLASPAALRPGASLQMPVKQVAMTDAALVQSQEAIQRATAKGARLFAPYEISKAIDNRDLAVSSREVGQWRAAVTYATDATADADAAYNIALKQRDRAAEALITDLHGAVEGRDPAAALWSNRAINDVLVEFERLRTLSNSTTQVTFRDLSRLRLNPNSNATIQRMRSDPVTGKEVTKVSLSNGDFYALLSQQGGRDEFEIEVAGFETKTESGDFWVKNDDTGARFVNYDDAEFAVSSDNGTVMLGRNQGALITDGQTQRAEVLDRAEIIRPLRGDTVFGPDVVLEWVGYDGAAGYWFEIAEDAAFNRMTTTQWGVKDTSFAAPDLPEGRYHWRVAALDPLGLPGEWSPTQSFDLKIDKTPPFLTLLSPASGALVNTAQIDILGASETGATITVNGAPVALNADGSFSTSLTLREGENIIKLDALDAAENHSVKRSVVTYRPAVAIKITINPDLPREGETLVTRLDRLTVQAHTTAEPGQVASLRDAQQNEVLRATVGEGGALSFAMPADATARSYRLAILSPTGAEEGASDITVLRDATAPAISLDAPPPRATADENLRLAGQATGALTLTLAGTSVPLKDGRFELDLTLDEGVNTLDFRATDAAGNVGVLTLDTHLDLDPPEILGAEITRPEGPSGPVVITVQARDESGIRQAAPYLIAVGRSEIDGFLRCDSASGVCQDTLPATTGEAELLEVVVQDYAGNEAFY